MQTMNFQCGHCSNLMAVSTEFLGQQVRCPHCGGVVIAPSAPAAGPDVTRDEPPAPLFQAQSQSDQEDIFGAPAETGDDLFGTEAPRLEIPRGPDPAPEPPRTAVVPETSADGPATGWSPPISSWAPPGASAGVTPSEPAPPPAAVEPPPPEVMDVRRPKPPAKVDWFLPLVFMPLILYAVGITAIALFLYARLAIDKPSLFDRMPDVDGDNPGVQKTKLSLQWKKADAIAPLPEHLHVKLKQTLRVGDLEVTPLKVERRKVAVHVQGAADAQPCEHDSLVMTLRLKNVGEGYRFTPIDNFFDRHWDGRAGSAPLTVLVAGPQTFFGGPAKWVPLGGGGRRGERREWLDGRVDSDPKGLAPGETVEAIVATDGDDKRGPVVWAKHRGNLLWRVHLRRGLVDHRGRSLPAQCVVGVDFTSRDYGGG